MANASLPLADRLWGLTDKRGPDECWLWRGATCKAGYGKISLKNRTLSAHRVAWSLANGMPVPSGLYACHACDNPLCVNPGHIWLGTQQDNMRDMAAKGRLGGRAGDGPRTKCRRGHPLTLENTISNGRGKTTCRLCRKISRAS